MKVVDLLSINKKEMPKSVKHYSGIYVWDKEEGDFFKGSGEGLLQWCVSSFDTQNHFIDEVEIIEEDKKIEKLIIGKDDVAWCEGDMKTDEEMVDIVLEIKDKINEIIDYINGGTNE